MLRNLTEPKLLNGGVQKLFHIEEEEEELQL